MGERVSDEQLADLIEWSDSWRQEYDDGGRTAMATMHARAVAAFVELRARRARGGGQ